ncbi:protein NUCLEAR FUSION DEFECTIVE 4-like [Tripterygium wilfordii]|uniref:Protein NUCLEAR FUSION DEFECTIVE 4-like n=2 Tax=Tripterygium wilfordii TaxID=458696 RepID=A0A7J7DXX1_TRIWF|nr:protein NUCLEAR FUSION DEFECTIVE 4-like [Tripterygium wilfordii]
MKGGFIIMFVITVITGIYAILSSLESVSSKFSSHVAILVCLFVLLVIPLTEKLRLEWEKKVKVVDNNNAKVAQKSGFEEKEAREVGVVMEEIGVKSMVQRLNFWLYFLVYLLGATIGLVFLNNLGQIAESRNYQGTSNLVSLSSSFGFFGRLMPSLLDFWFSRYKISRPACIVTSMASMVIAFFLLLSKTSLALYISTAVIGLSTGAITTLSVSTTTELFGTERFSINHNIVIANIPIGSLLFGYSAAVIYHKHANGAGKCLGMDCYAHTFIIWGCLCFLGTLLALALHFRTREFYSNKKPPTCSMRRSFRVSCL